MSEKILIKIEKIFLPTAVGILVYIVISKLFPEKVSDINSGTDLRSDPILRNHLIKKIVKKIKNDRSLKIALISVFATAGFQYFNQEIETLLVNDLLNQVCLKEVDGQLKIVCDIINEHELNLYPQSMKELIVTTNLSQDDKINLLKIKLDFILNGEYPGKKRFLLISIIAAVISVCYSGVGGLIVFLEALYRLFSRIFNIC